ncbi:portal protein [Aureimonas endophytica]|uniref:Portal protein n=1 Tax=Aureimonas endophytica TaxID=2027858 RepID=A0A916ZG14_9HYPH|nr:phage portal protein [Aureimonas endophytica]GGD93816.1 portal protein [Aureimonas endophytica]
MGLRSLIAAWRPRAPDRRASGGPGEAKTATLGGTLLFTGLTGTGEGERSYGALARDGFMRNPVVYRAVRLVAETVAAVPLLLYDGREELAEHALLDLLRQPELGLDGAGFVERIVGHLLLSGNAFVEATRLDGRPRMLHALRPDRVRLVDGADGWPEAYEYRVGSTLRRIPAAEAEGVGPLLHLRLFHPLSDGLGFAPLGAAGQALDLHNAAARWNRALIENSARPSGALVYRPGDGANLSPDQFDRLKSELESGYAGAARAGRPMLLEGGLDWKAMGLTPQEMDFMEAKNGAARDIALAFGIPPMLLGLPGDNTFANYQEANRAFLRLTVLPLLSRLTSALGHWLGAQFGAEGLRLAFDPDRIEGLAAEREALWARLGAASFLSEDEKREAVGYGPREAGAGRDA